MIWNVFNTIANSSDNQTVIYDKPEIFIKKIFNIVNLTRDEIIQYKYKDLNSLQINYNDTIIIGIFYSTVDKVFIELTSDFGKSLLKLPTNIIKETRLDNFNLLSLPPDLINLYELIIEKDSPLSSYDTAVQLAQKYAEKLYEEDKTKFPLVYLLDFKFGYSPAFVTSSVFDYSTYRIHPLALANPGLNILKSTTIGTIQVSESAYNEILENIENTFNEFLDNFVKSQSIALTPEVINEIIQSKFEDKYEKMFEYMHQFKSTYIYESDEELPVHTINHNLDSEFLITKIWVWDESLEKWVADDTREIIDDENQITIMLSEPRKIRVIIKKIDKDFCEFFRRR